MINGIVQTDRGFAVKDFEDDSISFTIGKIKYPSYMEAVTACCGRFYPASYFQYLSKVDELETEPDADIWENMIYAEDPRGVWDGEREIFKNVSSMDRGAATDDEIAYIDAIDATYRSLMAMVETK